jgi:hypothetical protein
VMCEDIVSGAQPGESSLSCIFSSFDEGWVIGKILINACIYSPMLTSVLQYRIRAGYGQSPRYHAHPGRVPGTSEAPHNFNLISSAPSGVLEPSVTARRQA